ncbi:hypothetical protein PILCRDRAFT_90986 [Piloderma croceum F 1598]|uniref:Crinkler effector protein N-terminal domain-containing protein n=1 Tax=Piloderma croceum (strain F 1598) TaxID=765440 RepID=A0A0C3FCW7_PILCF|nr:hypothetical protein PILCRDRAFT_90986 [Piloderma croceum F 1598]
MAMSLIQFKLKKADTSTRHANFNENPSWGYLSSVISQLFNIPLHHVGVAYINKHKNAKSLANKQELQGFYDSLSHPSEVIKFIVQDLMAPDAPTTITSTWSMDSNLSDLSQSSKQSEVVRPLNHSIISSDDKFKLFCWIFRKSKGAFLINIGKSETVGDLKVAIKKEKEHIVGVNTNTFNIWKLSSPIPSAEIDLKLGNVQTMEGILGCTSPSPMEEDNCVNKREWITESVIKRKWTINRAIHEIDIVGCYYVDPGTQDASACCLDAVLNCQLALLWGARASRKTTQLFWLQEKLMALGYQAL